MIEHPFMNPEDFRRVRDLDVASRDRSAPWLRRWTQAPEMHSFQGPQDLLRWFEWIREEPYYYPEEKIGPLSRLSEQKNKEVYNELAPGADYSLANWDVFNSEDYLSQNAYDVPDRMKVQRVLDFGAGYGRQINLYSQLCEDLVYVGVDAIELPYILQNYYYGFFDLPVNDYIHEPDSFTVSENRGIYHLPTWRTDLLPNNFFDLIICVQVLAEIDNRLVRHMYQVFERCLKPGGALYIRDHAVTYPRSDMNEQEKTLRKSGFSLEFAPYVMDYGHVVGTDGWPAKYDTRGLTRVWRKNDPTYPPYDPPLSRRDRILGPVNVADQRLLGGTVRQIYRKLRRK